MATDITLKLSSKIENRVSRCVGGATLRLIVSMAVNPASIAVSVPAGRKLAYIVRVNGLKALAWADKIEVAQVEGSEVVIQKGQFKVGDLAIYFEIDSGLSCFSTLIWLSWRANDSRPRCTVSRSVRGYWGR